MKRIISILLIFLTMSAVLTAISGCSEQKSTETAIEATMEFAKTGIDEYKNEVNNATAEDVADLKESGNTLMGGLDDVVKAVDEAGDALSDDAKTKTLDEVESLRQDLNEAMAKLDTK